MICNNNNATYYYNQIYLTIGHANYSCFVFELTTNCSRKPTNQLDCRFKLMGCNKFRIEVLCNCG